MHVPESKGLPLECQAHTVSVAARLAELVEVLQLEDE